MFPSWLEFSANCILKHHLWNPFLSGSYTNVSHFQQNLCTSPFLTHQILNFRSSGRIQFQILSFPSRFFSGDSDANTQERLACPVSEEREMIKIGILGAKLRLVHPGRVIKQLSSVIQRTYNRINWFSSPALLVVI